MWCPWGVEGLWIYVGLWSMTPGRCGASVLGLGLGHGPVVVGMRGPVLQHCWNMVRLLF